MKRKFLGLYVSFFLFFNVCAKKLNLFLMKDNVVESLNSHSLSTLKQYFNIDTFVETGTLCGGSTARAATIFDSVHTIELRENHYNIAKANLSQFNNVACYLGDSAFILKSILNAITAKTVIFWLDGHDDHSTPILVELEAIKSSNFKKDSIILIDDLQSFNSLDYPSLKVLIDLIVSINPTFKIVVMGDVLLAYPQEIYKEVATSPILDACTTSRLFDVGSIDISTADLIKKERSIGNAIGEEKKTIELLASIIKHDSHYKLWHAMIKFAEGKFEEVINDLDSIINQNNVFYKGQRTIEHWRLALYKALALRKIGNYELANNLIEQIRHQFPSFNIEVYSFE